MRRCLERRSDNSVRGCYFSVAVKGEVKISVGFIAHQRKVKITTDEAQTGGNYKTVRLDYDGVGNVGGTADRCSNDAARTEASVKRAGCIIADDCEVVTRGTFVVPGGDNLAVSLNGYGIGSFAQVFGISR